MHRFLAGMNGGRFEQFFRVYPVSFIDKNDAENGDKIFLPPSALDRLASLHIEYPMLFKVENPKEGQITHCGVLEFIAEEGLLYMPYWMMGNLLLTEGDLVKVGSATLPKGTYVKLQPHSSDFLDISNPKAVLEMALRKYSCLTVGKAICLNYNNKKYYIDIVEARPQNAITVIETDCEVDFAPPLDYKEPVYTRPEPEPEPEPASAEASAPAAEAEPEEPKFKAFVGAGRRLDGKAASSTPTPPPAAAAAASTSQPTANASCGAASKGTGAAAGKKPAAAGKVVFGGGNRLLAKQQQQQQGATAAPKPPPPEPAKEEDPEDKWKAFTGKGYSLKK